MEPDRIRLTVHPKDKELGQLTGMELTRVLLFLPIDLLGHRANPSWHNLPYSSLLGQRLRHNAGVYSQNLLISDYLDVIRLPVESVCSLLRWVWFVFEYAVPSGHARVFVLIK